MLADRTVSRFHAEIRRQGDRWLLVDLGSRHGTYHGNKRIGKPEPLDPGDEVAFGSSRIRFGEAPAAWSTESTATRMPWATHRAGHLSDDPVLVGASEAVRRLQQTIERVAPTDATVLIAGESGTGKGLVARRIHRLSRRASGPFSVVNCPALPGSLVEAELFGVEPGVATGVTPRPGRLEGAQGGTLLLDEVGDMELAAQARILQFLETKSLERVGGRRPVAVDVRILAATNHDLEEDIARGSFRRDLYHRLNVVTIAVPALRDRPEDIPLLVEHALRQVPAPRPEVTPEALAVLSRYRFPGNVRELLHVVESARLLATDGCIRPDDLPPRVRGAGASPAPGAPRGDLYGRIVAGGESFWDVVRGPFLRREVGREEVEALLTRAYREAGFSYKGVARLFRIEAQHKKLLNFLRNHGLGVHR